MAEQPRMGPGPDPGGAVPDASSLRRERAELDRALAAASTALYRLNEAIAQTRETRDWAAYDAFGGGGGFFASWFKRRRIDKVELLLRSSDRALAQLRAELAGMPEVRIRGTGTGTGSVHRTLDVWFDSFVADVVVHRRLRTTTERLEAAAATVVRLQSELGRRAREVDVLLSDEGGTTAPG